MSAGKTLPYNMAGCITTIVIQQARQDECSAGASWQGSGTCALVMGPKYWKVAIRQYSSTCTVGDSQGEGRHSVDSIICLSATEALRTKQPACTLEQALLGGAQQHAAHTSTVPDHDQYILVQERRRKSCCQGSAERSAHYMVHACGHHIPAKPSQQGMHAQHPTHRGRLEAINCTTLQTQHQALQPH